MFEDERRESLKAARKMLREVVVKFDSLPGGEDFSELKIRERFIASAVRWCYFDLRSSVISSALYLPALGLFLLTGWGYLFTVFSIGRALLGVLLFTVAAILLVLLIAEFSDRVWRLAFQTGLFRFAAGAALVTVSVTVYFMQRSVTDQRLVWVLLGSFSGGLAVAPLGLLSIFAVVTAAAYVTQEVVGVKRYDAALVKWVEAACLVHESRDRIQRFDTLRNCLVGIEKAARKVEVIGYPSKVSGLLESHQKALIRDESRRMAEAFRLHKSALAKVSRPEDVDAILESMMAGVKALAVGDTAALLENAPAQVSRSDRLRRFAIWILPPSMLISAGLLLPMIPAVASQGAAVESLRWSLIIAGVLSLAAAQKDVAARVNDTLGKTMSWK
ncbi:hypothetical protein [Streptomyces sp. R41]|uniref:Integral membrane protein n=1 Tax=Streptomyces sp. R41 TaxID=3238632 RepID=A0AB39RM47_9ACTN